VRESALQPAEYRKDQMVNEKNIFYHFDEWVVICGAKMLNDLICK
jgi:hypothetical protein